MPKAKPLSKEDIVRAIKYTKSNRAAAKYLGVSYQHYKPWAKRYKMDDGDIEAPNLFDLHKNQSGKGIPKYLPNKRKDPNVRNIVETGTGWESFTPEKIKSRLVAEALLLYAAKPKMTSPHNESDQICVGLSVALLN